MRANGSQEVLGVTLVIALIISILLIVPTTVAAEEDWHTGNTQLHDAINAAVFRLKQSGEWYDIRRSYNDTRVDVPDPLCLFAESDGEQIFQFPSKPVGTLSNILQRGYWAVVSPDRYNGSANPIEETPDMMRAIARIVGEHYGSNTLGVRFVLIDINLGTPAALQVLLDGGADSTVPEYVLTTTTKLTSTGNKIYMRKDIVNPSCGLSVNEVLLTVSASSGIKSYSELQQYVNAHPESRIAASGSGSTLAAKVQFPNAVVIDLEIIDEDVLLDDLLNGTYTAIWDFYFNDETPPQFNVISSGFNIILGMFTRYDDYSPSFAAQCTHIDDGCACGSGSSAPRTEINFNFEGMLRRD